MINLRFLTALCFVTLAAILQLSSSRITSADSAPAISAEAPPATQPLILEALPTTIKPAPVAERAPAAPPIQVGIILSQASATTINAAGQPYGFNPTHILIEQLQSPKIELFPIIERDTQALSPTSDNLQKYFANKPIFLLDNPAALASLDALVIVYAPTLNAESLNAIEKAVSGGVPLLIGSSAGFITPGFTPQVSRIHSLDKAIHGWNRLPQDATVVKAHPLLGTLLPGEKINLKPNGVVGILPEHAQPLLEIRIPELVNGKDEDPVTVKHPMTFSPLHLTKLGKGKVLTVGWAMYDPPPDQIQLATRQQFYLRALLHLANRPLD